ncbi:thiol peroxidase [Ligilactobacillus sp. Marseille-Q7487]|uniref:thiol peroxidase n=1 Tax=Ligilactobacillus sp. Marseille-Q7487 TaxID=3022128 RepID=UPI0024A96D1D|nr:thiol peroxidase [Ligilactobacillus sp. Marseille-Q7487]
MEISMKGTALQTMGKVPKVGEKITDFKLYDKNGQVVCAHDLFDKLTLISVVPDINTRVCSISTKRFNEEVDAFKGINFYTVSTNQPADQQNWCAAEGVSQMQLLSDKEASFGKAFGLYEPTKNIDSRSVWIINDKQEVVYQEVIIEQVNEPNYQAALDFLKN